MELIDLALAREVEASLVRTCQNISSYSEPSLKTGVGEDNWQIKYQNSDFMMNKIMW